MGWEIIERDVLLQEVIDSPEFKDWSDKLYETTEDNREVFLEKSKVATFLIGERVKKLIRQSLNPHIFYDGTNLQRETREPILELNKEGWQINAIYFDLPIDVIIERALEAKRSREGKFNEGAFRSLHLMTQMLNPPTEEEGFREIKVIRENREASIELRNQIKKK